MPSSFEDAVRSRLHDSGFHGDDASALARRVTSRRDALAANGGQRCVTCHELKPLRAFPPAPTESGVRSDCEACHG